MDNLADEPLLMALSKLSPMELLKLRTVNNRIKNLSERTLKQLKSLTIEYKFYAGMAVNEGKTHSVNNSPFMVKDEMILASKLLKFCNNLNQINLKCRELKEKSFSILCDKLINNSDSLTTFSLAADRFCQKYVDVNLVRLSIVAKKIESLTIGDGITEKDVSQFLSSETSQLKEVKFKYSNDKITGDCLINCPISLNTINISGSVYWWEVNSRFINKMMEAIKMKKLTLKNLIFECKGIKQDTINLINDSRLIVTLETLQFKRPNLYSPEMRLIELKPLINFTNLIDLQIEVFPFVDDVFVNKLLTELKKLKRLTIRIPVSNFHPLITDASIDNVSKNSKNLEYINFQNIRVSDNCIKKLIQLTKLNHLILEDVNMSKIDTIPDIINKSSSIKSLKIKQCLNLSPNQLMAMIKEVINAAINNPRMIINVEQETVFIPPKETPKKLPKNMILNYKYFNSNF